TGATGIMLNASSARGLDVEYLTPAEIHGFGLSSPRVARSGLVPSIEIGALKLTTVPIEVSETELTSSADGVIGSDVFRDFLIRIDNRTASLDLTPLAGSSCAQCAKAIRVGPLLLVRARVNGSADGYFILDSGSPFSLVSSKLAPSGEGGETVT